jgi:hypothetical protein
MDTINKWAILDSGATSNFLTTGAHVTNIQPAQKPIDARLPNGDQVQSTHTGTLDLPDPPAAARLAHIIPGLASHSLISVVKLCNTGCDVLFTKIGCTITHRGRTIMCGSKCMRTRLWMIPLRPGSQPTNTTTPPLSITAMAANVALTSTAGDHARFIHQLLCSPPTPSLLRALARSSELTTIPGLTPHLIVHHLPPSTATDKGHKRRHCQGVLSMRTQQPAILQARSDVDRLQPTEELCSTHDMFCFAALTATPACQKL